MFRIFRNECIMIEYDLNKYHQTNKYCQLFSITNYFDKYQQK